MKRERQFGQVTSMLPRKRVADHKDRVSTPQGGRLTSYRRRNAHATSRRWAIAATLVGALVIGTASAAVGAASGRNLFGAQVALERCTATTTRPTDWTRCQEYDPQLRNSHIVMTPGEKQPPREPGSAACSGPSPWIEGPPLGIARVANQLWTDPATCNAVWQVCDRPLPECSPAQEAFPLLRPGGCLSKSLGGR